MPGIGRQTVFGGRSTGKPVDVAFNLDRAVWHPVAITIDWGSVAAVSGQGAAIPIEGLTVPVGGKYLRYGQVMVPVLSAHAQTITVSGTPTGGSFRVNVYNPLTSAADTVEIPFNASVAATQTALRAFFGANEVTVTGAGALPGNVQTATFAGMLATTVIPTMTLAQNDLTGGTAPSVAFAVAAGQNAGMWVPYSSGAPERGRCVILNNTLVLDPAPGVPVERNVHNVGALAGGYVWRRRVLATTGTAGLANGPTWANLMAACPELYPVGD